MSPSSNAHPRLSLVVIAKNEADRIHRLFESCADIVDEIVVIDSGSTDATADVCRSHGARVIQQEWLGYVDQKQFAMEQAQGDWTLNLDADEALSPELKDEIDRALEAPPPDVDAFSMPRLSRYLNRWIHHGGWYPDRKVRLARRDRAKWTGDGIHEKLNVQGRVRELTHPFLHYVYRDIFDQVATMNQFSSVIADSRKSPGSPAYLFVGLFHALGKFLECAVWKLGLLDGLPGLVIAVNSAFYVFLKHAKAWERSLPGTSPDQPHGTSKRP